MLCQTLNYETEKYKPIQFIFISYKFNEYLQNKTLMGDCVFPESDKLQEVTLSFKIITKKAPKAFLKLRYLGQKLNITKSKMTICIF